MSDIKSDAFISGGISGFFFTLLSHPFHLLTTRYNREIINGKIEPSLLNSIKYSLSFIRRERLTQLLKGISIRTLQGTLTYSFLFLAKEHFICINSIQNETVKNITTSAFSGYIENIIIRQPFLTVTSAYINGDRILNYSLWMNVIKSYPLTSIFRSMYFTSSTIGKNIGLSTGGYCNLDNTYSSVLSGLFGIAFCIRFNGFSESFTNALSSGHHINICFKEGMKGSKNSVRDINLISRESLFLFPFLFPIDIQYRKLIS
jgi:hypothetical protein